MQIFLIHPSGHTAPRRKRCRHVRGPLSTVRRVPCTSRSTCACVWQLNLADIKHKNMYFIRTANRFHCENALDSQHSVFAKLTVSTTWFHVAWMARPNGTGNPVKPTQFFRLPCGPSPPATRLAGRPRNENALPGEKYNLTLYCLGIHIEMKRSLHFQTK